MASRARSRPENAPGDLFVDDTCIDCDTCRWMAPAIFDRAGEMSRVHRQPETRAEWEDALLALVACPTASIGTREKHDVRAAAARFPIAVTDRVLHCGYHDEASFGATSYLVLRPEGNVLVDAPRFAEPLVRRIEEQGGVRTLFLTHQDDVGDHARFAERFGCERVLHADDARGALRAVERKVEGLDPIALAPDLLVIPTPGHTRGSACLLFEERVLFSGDHVAWSDARGRVIAFRGACWYDWDVQIESMRRLAAHRFEWILPGHGRRISMDAAAMRAAIEGCAEWMESVR